MPPALEKEASFWEARNIARKSLVAFIIGASIATHMQNTMKATAVFFGVVVCSFGTSALARMTDVFFGVTEKHRQRAFNIFISTLSVLSMMHYLILALRCTADGRLRWLFADADWRFEEVPILRVAQNRMMRGGIPLHVAQTLDLPLIATPAGMDPRWAKSTAIFNLIIFGIIVIAIEFMSCKNCTQEDLDDRRASLTMDTYAILSSFGICYFSCVPGASISNDFVNLLRAGRSADSVLNHILKNSIAGAACLLEMDQETTPTSCSCGKGERLQQALEQLYKTMRWCSSRQVMVDLSAGRYQTSQNPLDVGTFLLSLCHDSAPFVCEDLTASLREKNDVVISFDEKMARLALENAISNAIAHGDRKSITLRAEFHENGLGEIIFTVENELPPDAVDLRTEDLEAVKIAAMRDIAGFRGGDKPGTTTPPARRPSMGRGLRLIRPSVAAGGSFDLKSSTSSRAGLRHIGRACTAAGGSFDLLMSEDTNPKVVMRIVLPATLTQRDALKSDAAASASLATPSSATMEVPDGLRICVIDDSKMICKGYERMVLPKLKADKSTSIVSCPLSKVDVDNFVDEVIGKGPSGHQPADIVILDQHIELQGGMTMYGTDLAHDLRSTHAFGGLVLIRSANSSEDDRKGYMKSEEVDGCLGKDQSHKEMVQSLRVAYAEKRQRLPSPWMHAAAVDF
eukprot:CAMPEP_0172604884 /NCGR_PEP_ID=MMETSP1068-20121228/25136_1 /TAXON_ID=35684 /ORGANISM="Pseudopedinella elastica, Strain CCMP716" /LENGTH=684 /DNA_ID=CAMNT_0013407111 /DNA_START=159 /DNA_END=2213 /DNA_ORIENTATION=+